MALYILIGGYLETERLFPVRQNNGYIGGVLDE
jgi:hypothetical protein